MNLSNVAPARERGLKFSASARIGRRSGRSREGAWIEINGLSTIALGFRSLPRGSVD